MTRTELADLLDDMANAVRDGDSLEGSIEYLLAGDATHPHQVRAVYRSGNRMGQGGMVVIGQDEQPPPAEPGDPWFTIGQLVGWLDRSNGAGEQETALRLMKLTEETGEVAQAYIGYTGQNPRKGITHSRNDVADELCDVIVTAMVALHRFAEDPGKHFAEKIQHIAHRSLTCSVCDGTGGDHQLGCNHQE
jgi:NTP pyrophosphatase (non-canonical NTP hydrolase)